MAKKTNKEVNNVEKYTYLSSLNLNKAENAVERLETVLGEDIDSSEVFDVIDASYEKDNKDIQLEEVRNYFDIETNNKKAMFWSEKAVKFYGLHNWAEYQKNKYIGEGE